MQGSKKKFRKSLRLEMKYENDTPHPQLPTVTPIVSTTTTTFTSTTSSGRGKYLKFAKHRVLQKKKNSFPHFHQMMI